MSDEKMVRLKWIGWPPKWFAGTKTVADWEWEDNRVIPHANRSRTIGPEHLPGLSQEYKWPARTWDRVLDVKASDAELIIADNPLEFFDVTDMSIEEQHAFQHQPIYVPNPENG